MANVRRDDEVPWDPTDPSDPDRRWWAPILVGCVALLLLGLLSVGLWLVFQAAPGAPVTIEPSAAPVGDASGWEPSSTPNRAPARP